MGGPFLIESPPATGEPPRAGQVHAVAMSDTARVATEPKRKIPGAVVAIAVIAWLAAAGQLLTAILLVRSGESSNVWESGFHFFVVGLLVLVGLDLRIGDPLGRVVAVVIFGLSILSTVLDLLTVDPIFEWSGTIAGAVLSLIGIILLFTPKVNAFFTHR